MAEPTATGVFVLTATGISIFGVATGLDPVLLVAGVAGGYASLSYQPAQSFSGRITSVVMSALMAAWGAPVLVAAASGQPFIPVAVTGEILKFPVALIGGFLAQTVIAPGLMALAKRKMESI